MDREKDVHPHIFFAKFLAGKKLELYFALSFKKRYSRERKKTKEQRINAEF